MNQSIQPVSSTPLLPSTSPAHTTGRRILVNTGALAGSNLWRIATSFVLTLLIARRLGFEALGQYTTALAYLNVCQVISELGLPSLLVRDLAQAPTQRRGFFRIALVVQITFGLLTWGGLVLLSILLPWPPETTIALQLVGASLPFYAITSVTQTFFQAGERMELVMGVEIFINTLILALSVVALWMGTAVTQLVGVMVVTQIISAGIGLVLVRRTGLLAGVQVLVYFNLATLWQRMAPFYGLSLADVLLQRVDILLLSVVGNATLTGIYSAAYQLVRVALKLVQSFWKALYPTLSRLRHQADAQYTRLAHLSLTYTLLALIPAVIFGVGIAQTLLDLIYGHSATLTAPVFQILIWSVPFFLLENYAVTLFMVEQRPLQSLLITALHVVTIIVLLPILTVALHTTGAAWSAVLAAVVGAGGSLYLLRKLQMPIALGPVGWIFLAGALSGLICIGLPWPLWIRLALAALLYASLIWWSGWIVAADRQTLRNALFRSSQ